MVQIARVLELMGSRQDHVAATLRGSGIRGIRGSNGDLNPIVRYLNQYVYYDAKLKIGEDGTTLSMFRKEESKELTLPEPVRLFLECFHRGDWPALEVGQRWPPTDQAA